MQKRKKYSFVVSFVSFRFFAVDIDWNLVQTNVKKINLMRMAKKKDTAGKISIYM